MPLPPRRASRPSSFAMRSAVLFIGPLLWASSRVLFVAAAVRERNSQVPTESKRREDKCSLYPYSSVACPRGTGASMPSSFARGDGAGLWGFGDVMFLY